MTTAAAGPTDSPLVAHLASRSTHQRLRRFVGRRVAPCDVDDVVQATLCDALASHAAPRSPRELERWLLTIARFKLADHHRAKRRRAPEEPADLPAAPEPLEERSLVRWAERQLPPGDGAQATFDWMVREAEGEKLEHIAAGADVPAGCVRQRVSRLRRWMRARWVAELAAALVLALIAAGAWRGISRTDERIMPEPASLAVDPRLHGTWRLVSFEPTTPVDAVRASLLERIRRDLELRLDGHRVAARSAAGAVERTYVITRADGKWLELFETSGRGSLTLEYGWEGEVLVVTSKGAWAGVGRLRR